MKLTIVEREELLDSAITRQERTNQTLLHYQAIVLPLELCYIELEGKVLSNKEQLIEEINYTFKSRLRELWNDCRFGDFKGTIDDLEVTLTLEDILSSTGRVIGARIVFTKKPEIYNLLKDGKADIRTFFPDRKLAELMVESEYKRRKYKST